MPAGVLSLAHLVGEVGVGLVERGELGLLAVDVVLLAQPGLHRQHEQGGDERGGDDDAARAMMPRLPRP